MELVQEAPSPHLCLDRTRPVPLLPAPPPPCLPPLLAAGPGRPLLQGSGSHTHRVEREGLLWTESLEGSEAGGRHQCLARGHRCPAHRLQGRNSGRPSSAAGIQAVPHRIRVRAGLCSDSQLPAEQLCSPAGQGAAR